MPSGAKKRKAAKKKKEQEANISSSINPTNPHGTLLCFLSLFELNIATIHFQMFVF